jgi:RNA polymerase sigma-70 factor (ECF subfamily)
VAKWNCNRELRLRQEEGWQMKFEPAVPQNDLDRILDLESLIRKLPDGCREVLLLHDIEGYTHEEIGNFLNIQNGTSKSQLFEARRKLRRWLSPNAQEGSK